MIKFSCSWIAYIIGTINFDLKTNRVCFFNAKLKSIQMLFSRIEYLSDKTILFWWNENVF